MAQPTDRKNADGTRPWRSLARRLRLPPLSLGLALPAAACLILGSGLGLGWQLVQAQMETDLARQLEFYGRGLTRQSARALAAPLQGNGAGTRDALLGALLEDGRVLRLRLTDAVGTPLQERGRADAAAQPFIEPVMAAGRPLGFLQLDLDTRAFAAERRFTVLRLGLGAACLLLLGVAGAAFLGADLSRALRRLGARLAAVAEGRLGAPEPMRPRGDDIGQALATTERLRRQLAARQDAEREQARFGLPPLAASLRREDGSLGTGRYLPATLLLVEFVNLGALSERLEPEALTELINGYHGLLARAAKLYNGQVDKYYGDGVLVLFGLPRQDPEHAFHALCATLVFQQLVQRFNETRPAEQCLQLRLCLHTGSLLAAILGDEQAQFAVLGDALNLVMRLATVAGPEDIVLSRELAELPELRQRVSTTAHRNVLTKGRSEPSASFRLLSLASPYDELVAGQAQYLLGQTCTGSV